MYAKRLNGCASALFATLLICVQCSDNDFDSICNGIFLVFGTFSDGTVAMQKFPSDSLTRWITSQSEYFTRKVIQKVSIFISIDSVDKSSVRLRACDIKGRFSIATGIYTLPNNLNLNIVRTAGDNNKYLVSKVDI